VVQRARQRGAGLSFAEGGKLVTVSRQDLVSGADDQLHDGSKISLVQLPRRH
jgi:hypothetical protein